MKAINRQIRMSDSLWLMVEKIAKDLGYEDARGAHSTIIREMVAAAAAKWSYSPYISRQATYVIFVSRQGDIFYRAVQVLKLNSDTSRLPCSIRMKPEKVLYYRRNVPSGSRSDWVRSRWLLNYFAAWRGQKVGERLIDASIDREGSETKAAALRVNLPAGRYVTREMIIGIKDYVQWRDKEAAGYDRVDVPIELPSHNLKLAVIVDEELFRHTTAKREISDLALEFRNLETARYAGKEVALYSENPMTELYGRFPEDKGSDQMALQANEFRDRIVELLEAAPPQGLAGNEELNKSGVLESFKIPDRFLFYYLDWPSPHLGVAACVRWEKPVRGG